jgi:hypothetical protein
MSGSMSGMWKRSIGVGVSRCHAGEAVEVAKDFRRQLDAAILVSQG